MLFDNLRKELCDSSSIISMYELCKRFPVEYDENYNNIFIRKIDLTKPYIEIEYDYCGMRRSDIGYALADFLALKSYETTTYILKFRNMPEEYTTSFKILKNECQEWDGDELSMSQFVSNVEWGDWIDEDTLELRVTRMNYEIDGTLQIKVYIKENPNIVAYFG